MLVAAEGHVLVDLLVGQHLSAAIAGVVARDWAEAAVSLVFSFVLHDV